jgi:hypothetical protein
MKKPDFMKNLTISYPEIEVDAVTKSIHNFAVSVAESFDNAIEGKIIDIAKEEGINSLWLLNKKEIVNALKKQIPQKPKKIGEEYTNGRWVVDYECAACGNPYADDSYCSCCGQALDWGDTE